MCLAVPGMILAVEQQAFNRVGTVQFGGITRQAYLDFVPEANVGDYVIVHVGFAISKLDEQHALDVFRTLKEMGELEGIDIPEGGRPV